MFLFLGVFGFKFSSVYTKFCFLVVEESQRAGVFRLLVLPIDGQITDMVHRLVIWCRLCPLVNALMEKYHDFNEQTFFRSKAGQSEFLLKKLTEM